jgi:NAD(P)-dependent dehydrogenase (short-subunit alcohol dehydrogenase family)
MIKTGKLCIVTGGSRGIGKGIALELGRRNYSVALTYNTQQLEAEKVTELINSNGGNAKSFRMKIENRSQVQSTLRTIAEYFKKDVSLLINNAAMSQEKPFDSITDADWEEMLRVNLQGPFICTQEILPTMKRNNWGRIINITSIGGQWGGFNQVHYAASKAALINFTQSIAKIYSGDGITSNAVAIGLAETEMSGQELSSSEGKKKVSNIPMGRIARIEEIADIVHFLCTDESSYITGQTINANGGMYFG